MDESELYKYLMDNFRYNMEEGSLLRSDRKNSNGSIDSKGYHIIKIKGKQYKAHRLVFLFCYGRLPYGELDHINRVRNDNRIENLRECTRKENIENSKGVGYGIYYDNTKGLKKNYAFKFEGVVYRFKCLSEAKRVKIQLGGKINDEYDIPKAR